MKEKHSIPVPTLKPEWRDSDVYLTIHALAESHCEATRSSTGYQTKRDNNGEIKPYEN